MRYEEIFGAEHYVQRQPFGTTWVHYWGYDGAPNDQAVWLVPNTYDERDEPHSDGCTCGCRTPWNYG